MKTSNRILIAVALIIVACLVGYDFAIKAEYDKGTYKSRFYNMEALNFKPFNVVKNNAANIIGIRVERGNACKVWMTNAVKGKIKFTKQGQTLQINYVYPKDELYRSYEGDVIITCPNVDSVTTSAYIRPKTNLDDDHLSAYATTVVANFKQAKITVQANKYTSIELENNKLDELNTVVGDATTGGAELVITGKNYFKNANLQVPGKSNLTLYGAAIGKCKYNIADSAFVKLYGTSLRLFK